MNTSLTNTTGYLHIISFSSYRNQLYNGIQILPTIKLLDSNDFSVRATLTLKQAPSPTISGNVTLQFNGTDFDIPGNAIDITGYFSFITKLDKNFYTERRGSNLENHYYIVRLSGLNDTPLMTVKYNNLVGGKSIPTVEVIETIKASNNIFYDPIPNELLFTFSKF